MYRIAMLLLAALTGTALSAQTFDLPDAARKQLHLFQKAADEPEHEMQSVPQIHWDDMPGTGEHNRADAHAPIAVMGDHMHHAGEFMLSYRFMLMDMRGLHKGSSAVDKKDVLDEYMVTPTDMTMAMHMFGAMWAPIDELTLMLMFNVTDMHMDHVTRMGKRFRVHSSGMGDTKLSLLVRAFDIGSHHLHFNITGTFPTGAIDAMDNTPASGGKDVVLPYPMQVGAGTFGAGFGFTYTGNWNLLSWGFQPTVNIQGHRNYRGYRLGNRFQSDAWVAVAPVRWASVALHTRYAIWTTIYGHDAELNKNMVPTADDDNTGGKRLDLGVGLNLYVPKGLLPFNALNGQRLSIEFMLPVMQSLNGYQLGAQWGFTVGWQWAF